jgi:hypothetical protein
MNAEKIMNDKQKQANRNGSLGIQAQNVYINDYNRIKEIFYDLFKMNFPKIQEIAKNTANERVDEFLNILNEQFIKKLHTINTGKFFDPNIQYNMQRMIINIARKGERINYELLSAFFLNLIDKQTLDSEELIIEEALYVLPKLTKKHLNFLVLQELNSRNVVYECENATIEKLDDSLLEFRPIFEEIKLLKTNDVEYMEFIGCIHKRPVTIMNNIPQIIKQVDKTKNVSHENMKKLLEEKKLENLLTFFNLTSFDRYYLSPIGDIICKTYLSQNFKMVILQEENKLA